MAAADACRRNVTIANNDNRRAVITNREIRFGCRFRRGDQPRRGGVAQPGTVLEALVMMIEEMSDYDCRQMLARTQIARLACALDNQPYIVPIRIDVDRDWLYAYSTLGQKIEWMRRNPLVCVEIDELTSRREWVSLIIVGRYEELPPAADFEDSRRIAERLFQEHAMWWEPGAVPVIAHAPRAPVVFRIHIERMTGRRARPEAEERVDDRPGDAKRGTGGLKVVARMIGERLRAHIR